MQPKAFEAIVAAAFNEMGFQIKFSGKSADGGVDIFALAGPGASPTLHVIQCKRWRGKVGIRIVRELFGVRAALKASKAVLVTTSEFTKPAIRFASDHPWEISLVDFQQFQSILQFGKLESDRLINKSIDQQPRSRK